MPDRFRKELVSQLRGGNAHAHFDQVVKGLPYELQGAVPDGLPYSAWQLLEHIRIAQVDMLLFCRNEEGNYVAPTWPEDYWPKSPVPPSDSAWEQSVAAVKKDLDSFVKLIEDPKRDLFERFAWGKGQTLFHEACLIIDHASYHLGEIVTVRRLLNAWPAK